MTTEDPHDGPQEGEALPLLHPDDAELVKLVRNVVSRAIYRVLYDNRDQALDIHQIRARIDFAALGSTTSQQHLDRRMRDLYPHFVIERERGLYKVKARLAGSDSARGRIDKKTRAWVLRDQRCQQCGRTPGADGVRLHVDHKIPQRWGGTDERENLQALCSECNEGKRDYFATLGDDVATEILAAANFEEPHRRIGEALKAAHPAPVRDDVLERIASTRQYQADWQKRLRELRVLGWKIETRRRKEGPRVIVYYGLTEMPPPWPENIRHEIRRRETARKNRTLDEQLRAE